MLLLFSGCRARTGEASRGPGASASQAQEEEDASSASSASKEDKAPKNAADPGSNEAKPNPGGAPESADDEAASGSPATGAPAGISAEELMRHGTVSEDGLCYTNDALGLQLTLPASSTGRPWHFVQEAAAKGEAGIGLSVCYDESAATSLIHIAAVSQEAYQKIVENDHPHTLMGENSRWAFLFSVSNGVPEGIEGTEQEEAYTTMRREARDWEAQGRVMIEEPGIP